jgi:hypothetical protein
VGYKFSLVLSREITDDEVAILRDGGCASANFTTDSLPTNAEVQVARLDFDDASSPSLAEAIESALVAVKGVPDLSVPGLTVPAQPAHSQAEESGAVIEGVVVEEKPSTRKSGAKRASKKSADAAAEDVSASAPAAADLVAAAAKAD